jgi:hypothetical protein
MVRNYNIGTTSLMKQVEAVGIYAGGMNTVYGQNANGFLMTLYTALQMRFLFSRTLYSFMNHA